MYWDIYSRYDYYQRNPGRIYVSIHWYFSSPFFSSAGITKAASKLSLRQEVKQQEAPLAVKPAVNTTVSSYPSNGQIHSQYHGYYVKADVKIPPPEEPIGVEDDFHPSSLARLPPPAKQIREPALKSLPAPSPSPVPTKESTKAPELPKPKRQESHKPKSLAETKKASMEISPEILGEESVSYINSAYNMYDFDLNPITLVV